MFQNSSKMSEAHLTCSVFIDISTGDIPTHLNPSFRTMALLPLIYVSMPYESHQILSLNQAVHLYPQVEGFL